MRAAAILGLGCSLKDLRPFQAIHSAGNPVGWRVGVPDCGDEVDAVLVFGGDGTIHRQLRGLVELGLPVLVVPGGSGNDFARALGFRRVRDSLEAWRRFCDGQENVRRIDLGTISWWSGEAGGMVVAARAPTYFCSVAGVGLDGEIARRANELPRWLRGHGGYVLSFAATAFRFAPVRMKISVQDEAGEWKTCSDHPTLLAACGNAAMYGGGMKIAPRASLEDGEVDVCVIGGIDPLRLFCLFPTVFFGRHLQVRGVSYFRARRVRIETEKAMDVYGDGELVCGTPVEIGVRAGALRVIV